MGVQEWLRKCIYQRSGIKSKSVNQLYVFVISAFWHGFYVSYYITFVLAFMQLHVQGLMFKYCKSGQSVMVKTYRKMGVPGKILVSFMVLFQLSHIVAPFLILISKYAIKYLVAVNFVPQIILFILLAYFSVVKPPKIHKGKHEAK